MIREEKKKKREAKLLFKSCTCDGSGDRYSHSEHKDVAQSVTHWRCHFPFSSWAPLLCLHLWHPPAVWHFLPIIPLPPADHTAIPSQVCVLPRRPGGLTSGLYVLRRFPPRICDAPATPSLHLGAGWIFTIYWIFDIVTRAEMWADLCGLPNCDIWEPGWCQRPVRVLCSCICGLRCHLRNQIRR